MTLQAVPKQMPDPDELKAILDRWELLKAREEWAVARFKVALHIAREGK